MGMGQVPMTIMRSGAQDLRVRPQGTDDMKKRGYEIVGRILANGQAEYNPDVAALDAKAAIREQQEREQRSRATAASLGQAVPENVGAQLADLQRQLTAAAEVAEAAAVRAANAEERAIAAEGRATEAEAAAGAAAESAEASSTAGATGNTDAAKNGRR